MSEAVDFGECLRMTMGQAIDGRVSEWLLERVPGAVSVEQASSTDDRSGTDYWVALGNGKRISVDIKKRSSDWIEKGCDDLALETWSVIEAKVPGWTRDSNKTTDYVLWLWPTGRCCLIPFPMLCAIMQENWQQWRQTFKKDIQKTLNKSHSGVRYHSECVFVPRPLVWKLIVEKFGGKGTNVTTPPLNGLWSIP